MPLIKAKVLPLRGKYYGTEVEVFEDGVSAGTFRIWLGGGSGPSDRELTLAEGDVGIVDYSHYENCLSLTVAEAVEDAFASNRNTFYSKPKKELENV